MNDVDAAGHTNTAIKSGATPCYVLHVASGDLWAGAEVQLFNLVRKLDADPFVSVCVVLLNHGRLEQELDMADIDVTVIDERTKSTFAILLSLVRKIQNGKFDVIHTHRTKENVLGSIAGLLAGGVPSIRTVHGAAEHKPAPWQLHKLAMRAADYLCGRFIQSSVIAVSRDLAATLSNTFPMRKLGVIENGIEPADFASYGKVDRTTGNNHNNTMRVGIVGRLVPVKRVDLFIRTAQYLMQHHPDLDASYHIYGDGPLRQSLEQLCMELCVTQIVHMEGHHDDIYSELAGLDVLLMTSDQEGTPMVLLEALAMNIPVIAHSTGGITELLDHCGTGTLVTDHTPHGYANALLELAANGGTGNRSLEIKARHLLSTRFSATHNAKLYTELYLRVTDCQAAF